MAQGRTPVRGVRAGCPAGDSLVVLPDPEALALAVAAGVVAEARRTVGRRGCFRMALSGGSTPRLAYEALARPPFAETMPWASTHVFWSDERCVAADDARSNQRMAREALLDHVPVPSHQTHPVRYADGAAGGASGEGTSALKAEQAAQGYERLLRAQGGVMDLILLGLGEDGHTASLFPGSEALEERERWALAVPHDPGPQADGGDQGPLWRVTLTAPYINQADCVFFVVSGAAKAAVLKRVLADDPHPDLPPVLSLPARLVRPSSGRLYWFVDDEAASGLDLGR